MAIFSCEQLIRINSLEKISVLILFLSLLVKCLANDYNEPMFSRVYDFCLSEVHVNDTLVDIEISNEDNIRLRLEGKDLS